MAPTGSPGPLSAPARLGLPTRSDPHSAWTGPLATRAASSHGHPEAQLFGSCISPNFHSAAKPSGRPPKPSNLPSCYAPAHLQRAVGPYRLPARVALTRSIHHLVASSALSVACVTKTGRPLADVFGHDFTVRLSAAQQDMAKVEAAIAISLDANMVRPVGCLDTQPGESCEWEI